MLESRNRSQRGRGFDPQPRGVTMGHFNFRLSLSSSPVTTYTHGPQGIGLSHRGYLHVLKYLLSLYLRRKETCGRRAATLSRNFRGRTSASLLDCNNSYFPVV